MIAQELVKDIQAMGLPAIEAGPGSSPQVGDGVIRGYIVSMEGGGAGSTVKRMVIGFGAGTAEMDAVVEGYVILARSAKTRFLYAHLVGKQVAWFGSARSSGRRHGESRRSDNRWRREDLWSGER
jgi:Domain of unknown function (DUF4410)